MAPSAAPGAPPNESPAATPGPAAASIPRRISSADNTVHHEAHAATKRFSVGADNSKIALASTLKSDLHRRDAEPQRMRSTELNSLRLLASAVNKFQLKREEFL